MDSKNFSRYDALDAAESIKAIVGDANVKINDDAEGVPAAVVTVSKPDQVASVVRAARAKKVPVETYGECFKGIAIDFAKLNAVEVDEENSVVKVQAGATWREVIAAACDAGFILGSHPFDIDEEVGVWLEENAVGVGTYRYSSSKDNVLNVEAILPDGTDVVLGYDKITSYMSGYNLLQLVSGSEGTLGVIVRATIRLFAKGVVKSAAYDFADGLASAEPAVRDVLHHASLKPYCFTYSSVGGKGTVAAVFHGDEKYVDKDLETFGAIMTAAGGVYAGEGEHPVMDESGFIVPAVCWSAFVNGVEGDFCGVFADKYTAYFNVDNEKYHDLAAGMGGRCTCKTLDSDKLYRVHDAATADYIEQIEKFFETGKLPYGKGAEKLTREVSDSVVEELEDELGKINVNTHPEERLLYSHDLAPLPKVAGIAFDNIPDVVVRPSTTEDLSRIMRIAYRTGVAVTPRGNSTWGLAGAQPAEGGIVVDFSSKMNKIEVDAETQTVKVQAGAVWKDVLEACMNQGYIVASYPSSFPAATVGAWYGTNGMGVGTYKFGSVKDNVLNLEAVLPDGTVINTGYENINNYYSGYNLNQFFAGSEGTLALFATFTMKIYPMGVVRPVAYEFRDALADANPLIQKLIRDPSLYPVHVSWADCNHFANQRKAGIHAPNVKSIVLLVYQGDEDYVDLEEAIGDMMAAESGGHKCDPSVGEHEWEERCYEFRARKVGVGEIPAEVVIPANSWGDFVDVCYKSFDDMKMDMGGIIGNIVDRNNALFMPYYFKDDESLLGMTAFAFNFYLGDRAMEYGGRTTGLGIFFAWNLDNLHDANTVALMREFKTLDDPHDVMNPGHVVCGMTRFGINMGHGLMTLGSALMQSVKKLLPQNTTFETNIKRFAENRTDEAKFADRKHVLGRGYE